MKKILSYLLALGFVGLTSLTQAEAFVPDALLKVKPGTCTLMVFQPDGLNAMPAQDIIVMDAETAMIVHHGLSDEQGLLVVDLDTGRYILAANGVKMAIIDVSAAHELSAIRLILSEESLQVGGADEPGTGKDEGDVPEEDENDRKLGYIPGGGTTVIAATTVATGAGVVIEHENDDGGGSSPEPEEPEEPTPPPPKKPDPEDPEDPPGPSEPVEVVDPCSMYRLVVGGLVNPCFQD